MTDLQIKKITTLSITDGVRSRMEHFSLNYNSVAENGMPEE